MLKRLSFIIAFLSLSLIPLSMVSAAGIGISPQSLEITQSPGSQTETMISVHNTGETTALYQIYADQYERLISIDGEEIRLAPGEGRAIPITVGSFPPGEFTTAISIVATEVSVEDLPKTGVKLPVTINSVSLIEQGQANMIRQYSLYFIAFALILLLLAMWFHSRRSKMHKLLDTAQETLASHSLEQTADHYRKKHPLIFISLLALLIAGGLLIWSFIASDQQPVTVEIQQGVEQYSVTIQHPSGAKIYTVQSDRAISAFSALEQVRDQYGISLAYDPPIEFGILVTEIDGYTNGEDGQYWVFEVNGKQVPSAADRTQLQPNDQLVWKFVIPSAE